MNEFDLTALEGAVILEICRRFGTGRRVKDGLLVGVVEKMMRNEPLNLFEAWFAADWLDELKTVRRYAGGRDAMLAGFITRYWRQWFRQNAYRGA